AEVRGTAWQGSGLIWRGLWKTRAWTWARRVIPYKAAFSGLALAVALSACSAAGSRIAVTAPEPTPTAHTPLVGAAPACTVTGRLIPSCGAWWGIAPEIF